jgi:hypothetical protein
MRVNFDGYGRSLSSCVALLPVCPTNGTDRGSALAAAEAAS